MLVNTGTRADSTGIHATHAVTLSSPSIHWLIFWSFSSAWHACVLSVDFIIQSDMFVCDRKVIKPDKKDRYSVYCGLQAVGLCQRYFPNMVIVSFRISRL